MFIKSCVDKYFTSSLPEVALVGRSNSGKSSFLNSLSGSKVARVSKTPGKTNLLNFFNMGNYILVDMPGYGYAKRSISEINKWKNMVENYLITRSSLKLLVLVMDIRRDLTNDEMMLFTFAKKRSIPIYIVLSKADKSKKSKIKLKEIKKLSETDYVFVHSSKTKEGLPLIKKSMNDALTKSTA